MLDRLKRWLDPGPAAAEPPATAEERLQLAAAALLVEAARIDGSLDEAERMRVADLLHWRFSLSTEEAERLVAAAVAETEGPAAWHGYAATVRAALAPEERIRLLEMIWEVIYADDEAHHLEENLVRRMAGLLHVDDRDSGAACAAAFTARAGAEPSAKPGILEKSPAMGHLVLSLRRTI